MVDRPCLRMSLATWRTLCWACTLYTCMYLWYRGTHVWGTQAAPKLYALMRIACRLLRGACAAGEPDSGWHLPQQLAWLVGRLRLGTGVSRRYRTGFGAGLPVSTFVRGPWRAAAFPGTADLGPSCTVTRAVAGCVAILCPTNLSVIMSLRLSGRLLV